MLIPSSPRSRGSSRLHSDASKRTSVVPALAGVIRRHHLPQPGQHGRPRARGGHPILAALAALAPLGTVSSPRSRGSSARGVPSDPRPDVVPALAGVIPGRFCLPGNVGVVPALAGVIRTATARHPRRRSRPRARGGHPVIQALEFRTAASSPRSRGSSPFPKVGVTRFHVVPALAGVIPCPGPPTSSGSRRPRARGGHPQSLTGRTVRRTSSPRSRGSSRDRVLDSAAAGVVPALAGVILAQTTQPAGLGSRPRARGGHPVVRLSLASFEASSPRSRGSSLARVRRDQRHGVVPALAGVIRSARPRPPDACSRPRARGGHPSTTATAFTGQRSSPRSRGCHPSDSA